MLSVWIRPSWSRPLSQVQKVYELFVDLGFDLRWVLLDGQHLTGAVYDLFNADLLSVLFDSPNFAPGVRPGENDLTDESGTRSIQLDTGKGVPT